MFEIHRRNWSLAALILLLCSTQVRAEYKYFYVCPKFAGGVAIGDGVLGLHLFAEHPQIGEVYGGRSLVLDRYSYKDCGNAGFYCIENDDAARFVDNPIVVPRVVEAGGRYEYRGVVLEARPVVRERYKQKRAVQIVAQRRNAELDNWYSLTVVDGVGVVDLHIPVVQTTRSATGDPLEIKDLTCYLDSTRGLFPKVSIRKVSPEAIF